MRPLLVLSAVLLASTSNAQLSFCSPQGNVALFSNYDGGPLTINVDQDIPDLHIGIVSYEFAVVNIVGPYAENVAAVEWAGFNGVNDHCGTGAINHATSISGAPAGTAEILVHPPATLSNTNGNALIICNYSCDIGSVQGGCNTADQIAHFFLSQWGGVLLFHRTQYGCWDGVWNISDGGNCCEDPLSTAMGELQPQAALSVSIVHGMLRVVTTESVEILDPMGRLLRSTAASQRGWQELSLDGMPSGTYIVRAPSGALSRFFW